MLIKLLADAFAACLFEFAFGFAAAEQRAVGRGFLFGAFARHVFFESL
ncbi:MAG TPA: hypothetical protein VM937_06835 [Burkholderiaceae bacterium]|nr:hypothetical protein [Burkholderiaceae bacterium]